MIKNLEQELLEGQEAVAREGAERAAKNKKEFWKSWHESYDVLFAKQHGKCACGNIIDEGKGCMQYFPEGPTGKAVALLCEACSDRNNKKSAVPSGSGRKTGPKLTSILGA